MADSFELGRSPLARRLRHDRELGRFFFVLFALLIAFCTGLLVVAPFWIGFSHPEAQEIGVGLFGDAVLGWCVYRGWGRWPGVWGNYGQGLIVDDKGFTLRLQTGSSERFDWETLAADVKLTEIVGPRVREYPWIELHTSKTSPSPLTTPAREALLASATGAGVDITRSRREEHGKMVETILFRSSHMHMATVT